MSTLVGVEHTGQDADSFPATEDPPKVLARLEDRCSCPEVLGYHTLLSQSLTTKMIWASAFQISLKLGVGEVEAERSKGVLCSTPVRKHPRETAYVETSARNDVRWRSTFNVIHD